MDNVYVLWRQLGLTAVHIASAIAVVYLGHRLVRWSDARAKRLRDAEYALRLQNLSLDLAQLEAEKRKAKTAGE